MSTATVKPTTKDLLEQLRGYHHDFLSEEGIRYFCQGFNVPLCKMQEYESDPAGTFKGLTFYDKNGKPLPAGTKRMGNEGWVLALHIAEALGGHPRTDFHGRGFQHDHCCDVIAQRL